MGISTPNEVYSVAVWFTTRRGDCDPVDGKGIATVVMDRIKPRYIFLLAIVLRFIGLGVEPLWYDEAFTAWITRLPTLESLTTAVRPDLHPPTWHIVSWLVAHVLGTSEWALRLPAALFGIAAVWLLWRIAVALKFEPRTANTAAFLVAILPMPIYYSQEARVYSFLCCAVLVAVLGAIERRWWVMGVGLLATAYSHNLGLFYCAAIGGVVLFCERRSMKSVLGQIVIFASVGLGWLPFAGTLIQQVRNMQQGFWIQPLTINAALEPLVTMVFGLRAEGPFLYILWTVGIVASGVGLIVSRRWLASRNGLILLATIFGTPALIAVISVIWRSVYLARVMLPGAMLLMLFWAYALNHLSLPNRMAMRRALAPVMLVALIAHYRTAKGRLSWDELINPVTTNWQAGDVIYYSSIAPAIMLGYYTDKPSYIWPAASDANQFMSVEAKQALQFNVADFASVAATHKRIWYVRAISIDSRMEEIEFGDRIEQCGTQEASIIRDAWALKVILVTGCN